MKKAILVIDMPRFCSECSLMVKDEYSYFCPVKCDENKTDLYEDYIRFHRKPGWCPLKELPEKKYIDKSKCSNPFYEFDFEHGYNMCINEILNGG